MSNSAPEGFYDDGAGRRRWWNGTEWTARYEDDSAHPAPSNASQTNEALIDPEVLASDVEGVLGADPVTERELPATPSSITSRAPYKVCPHCSTQSQTDGNFCPSCGKPFERKRNARGIKIAAIVVGAVIVIGAGIAISTAVVQNNQHVAAEHQAQAAQKAKAATAAAAAAAKQVADSEKEAARASDVTQMEASITKDANAQVAAGVLDPPNITKTSCTPLGGGSTDDLTAITTTYTCIAINSTATDGTESGYKYSATMNWTTSEYTWQLGN